MCVSIFGILFDDAVKVLDCVLVILDHLVSFGSLVDVFYFGGDHFNALKKIKKMKKK